MKRKTKARYRLAVWLHFDDEAPRIGSGRRPVIIKSKGPKWVYLVAPSTGFGTRLSRKTFDQLMRAVNNRS